MTGKKSFQLQWLYWLLVVALLVWGSQQVQAQEDDPVAPLPIGSPIHPTFPLLDENGDHVLINNNPVSTLQTCGSCHDVAFITEHSFHADVGVGEFSTPYWSEIAYSWDSSPGYFGRWDPLLYRYLSPQEDEYIDLTTAEWLQTLGIRHAGSGPATTSRFGIPLKNLIPQANNVETTIYDEESGQLIPWDWEASGTVEMNCFLCHTPNANNEARTIALQDGNFAWANTATLAGTGIVDQIGDHEWAWNPSAFDVDGNLWREYVTVQDPTNENCGQCHGVTHSDPAVPLQLTEYVLGDYTSMTTGQVMSGQKISQSGLNIAGKTDLSRSWDIHTERVIECSNCHYALNNPVYFQEASSQQPDHLLFDPRRIDLGEYIYRPLHQFAKGDNAQSSLAPAYDDSLRRCESCHSIDNTHDWLPYKERHTTALACESCHIPKLYAPALEYVDWTVLTTEGEPAKAYRGMDGTAFDTATLLTGYEPVLLSQEEADGHTALAPYNLITYWYWVYGDPVRPVPQRALEAIWLEDGQYTEAILTYFDANQDGTLSSEELVLSSDAQAQYIAEQLAEQGFANAHVVGEIRPYNINHNVTNNEWVNKDCQSCHSEDSRLAQTFTLADRMPAEVIPTLAPVNNVIWSGVVQIGTDNQLTYQPHFAETDLYILGHNAVELIDRLGVLLFLGVMLGTMGHAGLRYSFSRRALAHASATVHEVYMYDVYERLWHWLQTGAILILTFTGLIIHKPDMFGAFSFRYVVQVHNIVAAILVLNAILALFYHLASGEIQQFLPRPRGFFGQAIEQVKFYLYGIFHDAPHPFDKTRERKLNPLQQMTYFAILNVLLPLQILTGALMWGAQKLPDFVLQLGGLPFLAPFHTLIAWLFSSFIVLHVYLTTTGHTPFAGIRAMMLGWDEVEVHESTSTSLHIGDK